MRLSTKLKHISYKYIININNDSVTYRMTLIEQHTGKIKMFQSDNWSSIINDAYIHFKQRI